MGAEGRVVETAEAVCSALWRLDWQVLGNSDGGRSTWLLRGVKPKQVRIEVARLLNERTVRVVVEWHNHSFAPQLVRGQLVLDIDTRSTDDGVRAQTEAAVLRCLEVFRDVLEEKGLAGKDVIFKSGGVEGQARR